MEKLEVTSMSSRGQVVIPQEIRERLHLQNGEKFIVIGADNTIILKKMEAPSFKGFDNLLKKTRAFAKEKKLTEKDITEAIKETRQR
ncbi:MAG TPA: AbrB/MazE/SpoVT family DNA-binding domain-containing protein [Candidatus Nanoarchaeia archaeon]|nr:AbrB/MazE/SpoVT family DNA-binding domain-containing protein [Candidatus Nanoarchaeia archaeon]